MLKNLLMEAAGKWEEWDVGWWGDLAWELRGEKKKYQNGIPCSFKPLTSEKETQGKMGRERKVREEKKGT